MNESHAAPSTPEEAPRTTVRPDIQVLMEALQNPDPEVSRAAEDQLRQWVVDDPSFGIAHMGLGIALARRAEWNAARQHLEQAVAASPKLAPAHTNLGNLYRQLGLKAEARKAYLKAIELQPNLPDAHYNLSVLYEEDGDEDTALESVRRALLFRPNYPEAHNNLGHLLIKAGKVEQALSHFRQALVWAPHLRPAAHNLILALYRLGRSVEAQAEVDRQLKERPDDTHILRVQAAGLMQQGRLNDAEAINQRLLELEPDAADVHFNQGEVLLARQDYEGALTVYQDLIKQRHVPPALGIGAMANVMRAQGNYAEAKKLYQQALMMDSRLPPLVVGMGRTLIESGEIKQGLQTFRQAVRMLPHAADIHSLLLEYLRLDPDTTDTNKAEELKTWRQAHEPQAPAHRPQAHQRKAGEALRVGFLLGQHAQATQVSSLLALLEAGTTLDMELFFYQTDTMVKGWADVHAQAAHWRPVATLGINDLTEQIRQDAIDILVDLIGHTEGSRLNTLAVGAAAVQISWTLHSPPPGTSGVDHLLTHAWSGLSGPNTTALTPPYYAPPQAPYSDPGANDTPPRNDAVFTLGSIAPLAHLNAQVLDVWAQILEARPQTRLKVLSQVAAEDTATRQRWVKLMLLREIDPERVVIESTMSEEDHAQAIRNMDLVLDTFPVSMGLTALQCLEAGTPVLMLKNAASWCGETSAALGPTGLDTWIAPDKATYVARALQAIDTHQQRHILRASVQQALNTSPVRNKTAFVEGFQSALHHIWQEAVGQQKTTSSAP